ncbi:MAG: S9 family peptidase [Gemmatimonadetes bacterium]|nr:S9 family peptidase [Gemmatimonadota bacterium]
MHRRTFVTWVGAILLALASAATAQTPRPMTIVDLLNVPGLSDAELSPDGRQLVYALSTADWERNRRVNHVWRVNVDGSGSVQLTNGTEGESGPAWSPDGSRIAFLARRGSGSEEETQIFLLPNTGGEAIPLGKHPTSVSNITWSPDGRFIYLIAADDKTEEEKAKEEDKDDVFAFDENFKQRHLWRMSLADAKATRITSGDFSVGQYSVSLDGMWIAHHRAPSPLIGDGGKSEVWVMGAAGDNPRQLTRNGVGESGAALSPDNQQLLFLADGSERFEPYFNSKIFLMPGAGGPARLLMGPEAFAIGSARWSADGRSIFFVASSGVRSDLYRYDVARGRQERLTTGDHAISGWRYQAKSGTHLFGMNESANPGDLWTLASTAGAQPVRVTRVFDYLARDYRLPRQEAVQWKGADGVTVEGMLYYPLDYQAGQRYALVVQTHGGPRAADQFGFPSASNYEAVLASKGYFVLQPNYRGSTGYGDAFLRDMVGHYFNQAHLDVMTGVDHLIARGMVDGDRMAKMGWSGGGHMTNKIITFTNRFKAASSGAGAVNWISMYAQSDTRTFRTPWFGGTPWQTNAPIDNYWDSSPLKDIAKVTTPTLVLVGQNDVRVPMPQSVELYRALKSNGVPTRLYVAPREPHGWQELRHRLFKANVELEWFEKWVMGRTYTWEKPPASAAPVAAGGNGDGRGR